MFKLITKTNRLFTNKKSMITSEEKSLTVGRKEQRTKTLLV